MATSLNGGWLADLDAAGFHSPLAIHQKDPAGEIGRILSCSRK
jgi:hypothetical protein